MLSQRTVAKFEALLNSLLSPIQGYLPLLPRDEYRRLLYGAGVPFEVLEQIGKRYRWEPKDFLPALYDGRVIVSIAVGDRYSLDPTEVDANLGRQFLRRCFIPVALTHAFSLPDHCPRPKGYAKDVLASLERDGYVFIDGKTIPVALKDMDLPAEEDYLTRLLRQIGPPNLEEILHHRDEADKAFANQMWGAASSETRNFLTSVLRGLREAATETGAAPKFQVMTGDKNLIQNFQSIGLLTQEEVDAIEKVRVLLGYSGSHPGIQEQDRARLTRLLVLGMAQWICLQFLEWRRSPPGHLRKFGRQNRTEKQSGPRRHSSESLLSWVASRSRTWIHCRPTTQSETG